MLRIDRSMAVAPSFATSAVGRALPVRSSLLLAGAVLAVLAGFPAVGHAGTFSWTKVGTVPTGGSRAVITAPACPSATQCTLVDVDGQQVTFDPTATSPGSVTVETLSVGVLLTGLACPSVTQCTATAVSLSTGDGQLITFDLDRAVGVEMVCLQ